MSTRRKLLFAIATIFVFLGILEATAQLIWWRLQERAFAVTKASGEKVLRNDAINFMKQADGTFGYVLKPGFQRDGTYINDRGFAQRATVQLNKSPGTLRLAALGESTTQGHHVDNGNYPIFLQRRINDSTGTSVEMINGGVAGWVSDQIALWAEKKISAYRPDIVVLYVGWNDFQSYDPLGPRPIESYFDRHYDSARIFVQSAPIKSIAFASAAYSYYLRKMDKRTQKRASQTENRGSKAAEHVPYKTAPAENYHFYLRSLDRIFAAFRAANPGSQLVICTLVGRWPDGAETDYKSDQGATWWMKLHELGPVQAAATLNRFNTLVRGYAKDRGLVLIDAAEGFTNLDRSKLQTDFAHMTSDGYELLAEMIYDGLRAANIVTGNPSPRLAQLRGKYTIERPAKDRLQTVEAR